MVLRKLTVGDVLLYILNISINFIRRASAVVSGVLITLGIDLGASKAPARCISH